MHNQKGKAPHFGPLGFGCDLHFEAKSLIAGVKVLDLVVGKATKLAGSLKLRGALDQLRQKMKFFIRSLVRPRQGVPPLDAVRYQQAYLDLFFGKREHLSRDELRNRVILEHCFPGDWRNTRVLEFYTKQRTFDVETICNEICKFAPSALLAKSRPMLDFHRWEKYYDALQAIGSLVGPSGLGRHSYPLALKTTSGTRLDASLEALKGLQMT